MKKQYKSLLISALSLAFSTSFVMAQTDQILSYPLNIDYANPPADKDPKFNTQDYESWLYKRTENNIQKNLPFRLLKPNGYNETGAKYPLIIMFHGKGEAGTDNNFHLKNGGKEHLTAVKSGAFPGMVVFPQEPYGAWTNGPLYKADGTQPGDALKMAWRLIDLLLEKYNLDPNRVYIHGLSSGGTAVWSSLYHRPELFAAALPMSTPGDPSRAYHISTSRIWLFQGEIDENPIAQTSRDMMSAIRNNGACYTSDTRYTEYAGWKHDVWLKAYVEPDFYPFMLRNDRRKIKILGVNPFPVGGHVSLGVVGGMQAYRWYKNGVLVPSQTSFRWDEITSPGTYKVEFRRFATDPWMSDQVVLTQGGTNDLPTVSIIDPWKGASFKAPATIIVRSSANDPDGCVKKVEYFLNGSGTPIFTATVEPYWYKMFNLPVGTYTLTAKATDNSGGVTTSAPLTFTVNNATNQPPLVEITSPTNNSVWGAPAKMQIDARAMDVDGKIVKVEFYKGNTLASTDTYAPYTYTFYNEPTGTYAYKAIAYDDKGAIRQSDIVNVSVVTNQAPTVSITSPANYTSFPNPPTTVNITANAADANGTVSKVEFYSGTDIIGTDYSAPFQLAWSNVPEGSYLLRAKATDNLGSSTTSNSISITVGNVVNPAPDVTITSPVNNATYPAIAKFLFKANATDADGIDRVEFYSGTTLLGTDTYPPFEYTVYNQPAGTHSLTAKAFDKRGAPATSSAVTLIVAGTDYFNWAGTCVASGQSIYVELKSAFTANATQYSWSFSGNGVTITPNAQGASLSGTPTVSSGDVCVGVTYSGSPSKIFCKNVSKCSSAREEGEEDLTTFNQSDLVLDPSNGSYGIRASKEVQSVSVFTVNGESIYTGSTLNTGDWLNLAALSPGIYLVQILYVDGSNDVKRMPKLK